MNAHQHRIDPRYVETDQGGRVHHSAFVPWLEEARVLYLKACGVPYQDVEDAGFILVVRQLDIRYLAPVQFGTPVDIETRIQKLGGASVDFSYVVKQNGIVCAEAITALACVNRGGKPTRLPHFLVDKIHFENR